MAGADTIQSSIVNRAFRKSVLSLETKFLKDGNLETRHHAQEVVTFLMTEGEDFGSVFCNGTESNTRRRTGRIITPTSSELCAPQKSIALCERDYK
jgi:hypothetical protein